MSDRAVFARFAEPSLESIREPDSRLSVRTGYDSIQRPYNEILDEAREVAGLEGVVLIHQDMELNDASLLARMRPLLREPRVGVIGLLGARGVLPHIWWEAEALFGTSRTPLVERRHSHGPYEVEAVDGALLVLAPWVASELRFDEALAGDFHGYDVDLCLRVRAAGGRVICDDFPYLHHMSRPWADGEQFARAGRKLARRWGRELDPRERVPSWSS